jgi:hypothetical protein
VPTTTEISATSVNDRVSWVARRSDRNQLMENP